MVFNDKTKWTNTFIIVATILIALSQLVSSGYQEELTKTLGQNMILLNIREAMNEYLLRYQMPENASSRKTDGGWTYFDKPENLNAYFTEIEAFGIMAPYVNEKSWIYVKTPKEFDDLVSEEVKAANRLKWISNVLFILGLIASLLALLINSGSFDRYNSAQDG